MFFLRCRFVSSKLKCTALDAGGLNTEVSIFYEIVGLNVNILQQLSSFCFDDTV